MSAVCSSTIGSPIPPAISSDDLIRWVKAGDAVVIFDSKTEAVSHIYHNCLKDWMGAPRVVRLDALRVIYLDSAGLNGEDAALLDEWSKDLQKGRCIACTCNVAKNVLNPQEFPHRRHFGLNSSQLDRSLSTPLLPNLSMGSCPSSDSIGNTPSSISSNELIQWLDEGDAVVFFSREVISQVYHNCAGQEASCVKYVDVTSLRRIDPGMFAEWTKEIGAKHKSCECSLSNRVLTPDQVNWRHFSVGDEEASRSPLMGSKSPFMPPNKQAWGGSMLKDLGV